MAEASWPDPATSTVGVGQGAATERFRPPIGPCERGGIDCAQGWGRERQPSGFAQGGGVLGGRTDARTWPVRDVRGSSQVVLLH